MADSKEGHGVNPVQWLHGRGEEAYATHIGQILLASIIHEFASHVADSDVRDAVQTSAARLIANTGGKLAAGR